jgi:hypothetical protein
MRYCYSKKKLRVMDDSKDITDLVTLLEFMPLAIVQAAAYIAQKAPRCSARQYMEKFKRSDKEKTILLDYQGGISVETGKPTALSFSLGNYHLTMCARQDHQQLIYYHL